MASEKGLTPAQEVFAQHVAIGKSQAEAYRTAYPKSKKWKEQAVWVAASRLMANDKVSLRVKELQAAAAEKAEITAADVLREAFNILTADARELVSHIVHCCRYCYGIDHRFQRTQVEMDRAREEHAALVEAGKADGEFDEAGGVGYDERLVPHKDCPVCFGRGVGQVVFADTRNLSKQAAALYAGVKVTKEGMEVKLHSKDGALEKLFRHFGLYEKDNKQKTDPVTELLQQLGGRTLGVTGNPEE